MKLGKKISLICGAVLICAVAICFLLQLMWTQKRLEAQTLDHFYGTERTQYPKEGKLVWTDPNARSDALIYLTINAMDGTILDRGLSY